MLKKKYLRIVFALTAAIILGATGCSDPSGNNPGGDLPSGGGTVGGGSGTPGSGGGDPGGTGGGGGSGDGGGNVDITGSVTITASSGWLETFYVTWEKLAGAEKYNVYYRGGAISDWTRIDDFLIREYDSYFRADILGISAGSYEVKVHPVFYNTEGVNYSTRSGIEVRAHERTGFAFANGQVPGAYNMDGTPKAGARIIYLTESNKNTVSLSVKSAANREEVRTGLNQILRGMDSGWEDRPLIIRVVGTVTHTDFSLESGDILFRDNRRRNDSSSITIEGVGNDALAHGWGIRTNRASHIEIRNLGVMLTENTGGDNIELQNSSYLWVHHTDMFYGRQGSGDMLKGDGALDIKNCDFVTIAFNHFLDTGKSSLLGNQASETMGHITYHHNHFNHSDSRHPRVRVHQVHVYNNYFEGIGNYAVGATLGSSVFIENNSFRQTRNPILISRQGTDVWTGSAFATTGGTFSSENGGMIKAFGNSMDAFSQQHFRPWAANNTVNFDAYVTSTRNESVPDTVTARQGGAVYSNFDQNLPYTYTVDTPERAVERILAEAGRYWKGDISWTFSAGDHTNTGRIAGLDSVLRNYRSRLVSIQGERLNNNNNNNNTGGGDNSNGNGNGTPGGGIVIDGAIYTAFGMTTSSGNSVFVTNPAFTIVRGNGRRENRTVNGVVYDTALRLESTTLLTFTTSKPMMLTLYTNIAGGNISVNDNRVHTTADGTVSVNLGAGNHSVERGQQQGDLWLAVLSP